MLFYLRVIVMLPYFAVVAILGLLLTLVRPFNPDNSRLVARMFAYFGMPIAGLTLTRQDLANFDHQQPCVIVSNHQDNLDLFVLGTVIPPRTVSIGKKSLLWMPIFGIMYWLAGNVLIDRGHRTRAIGAMDNAVEALKTKNTTIWVFAEGTRNRGKNMLPFKKGAFRTAIEAGVPIVPVCVSSYRKQANFNRWHAAHAIVRVLPAISTKGMTSKDTDALLKQCFDSMTATIAELDAQAV